jgi:hypothetical protein
MFALVFALSFALVGLGSSNTAPAPVSGPIVPGKMIGPIVIGMPFDAARGIMEGLGPIEDHNDEHGLGTCNQEPGVGFCIFDSLYRHDIDEVILKTPGQVAFVGTDDERFGAPPLKVGVLAERGALETFIGAPHEDAWLLTPHAGIVVWWSKGVSIFVSLVNGEIQGVHVFVPITAR